MIEIRNLHSYYGQIAAIKGIDMDVEKGRITSLIGSNGAGKTTLLNSISGMMKCSGSIRLDGKHELLNLSPRKIAMLGVAHVPEGRHVFNGLTVRENLEMGAVPWHRIFAGNNYEKDIDMVYEMFPRLRERKDQLAWSLSGGEQQMLAMGRALMSRPDVLLLDEPSMGLAPMLVTELFKQIRHINEETGMTILLIEQNARVAMSASDYTYVIEQGLIRLHGPSSEIRTNNEVLEAYLGKHAAKGALK